MRRFASFLFLTALGACTSGERGDALPLHMVIDAGSSGTRVCLFGIARNDRCRAYETSFGCKDVPAKGGLADQGSEAKTTIEKALSLPPAGDLRRIERAVLLGTGGFRRVSEAQQKQVLAFAGQGFQSVTFPAELKVIAGEEEGRLAWLSVGERGSDAHAILEIGGATVQLATGRRDSVRAISTKDGMNDAAKRLTEQSACFTTRQTGCKTEIRSRIFAASTLGGFSAGLSAAEKMLPLYGLGAPWNAVFAKAGKDELTLEGLETQADAVCAATVESLKSSMPEEHAKRACYLHSFALELLRTSGWTRIKKAGESWPRGAAVSNVYFPNCR